MRFTLNHYPGPKMVYEIMPSTEEQIQDICRAFEIENTNQALVTVAEVHDDPDANALLAGKEFRLDELNYLMKRIDGFDNREADTFYGVASAQKLSSGKDLINLTFNTNCYNVLSNFENLNQQGKQMYLNEKEWVQEAEFNNFDGQKYIEDMIAANPTPQLSPYGFIYPNSNQPTEVYDGTTFPLYAYSPCPVTVVISQGDASELLELPTPQSAIDKALERMEVTDGDIVVSVMSYEMPDNIAEIGLQQSSLAALNVFAKQIKEVGKYEYDHLSNLVSYTGITKPEELKSLIETMHEFELYPGVKNHRAYGQYMICESGHFEYDDNLEEYIDFEGYGRDRASEECGAFTPKGYVVYHGYNQKMEQILHDKLGLSVKEPEPMTELKLYMPLKVVSWQQEDDWGHYDTADFEEELDSSELFGYEDDIRQKVELNTTPKEKERGLMAYYNKSDTVNAKVQKYVFDVERQRGELFGVAILTLHAPLNEEELQRIKDEITGQAADGIGESLEQQEIRVDGREVNVSLWNSDGNWSLKTAEEMGFDSPKFSMTMGGM